MFLGLITHTSTLDILGGDRQHGHPTPQNASAIEGLCYMVLLEGSEVHKTNMNADS